MTHSNKMEGVGIGKYYVFCEHHFMWVKKCDYIKYCIKFCRRAHVKVPLIDTAP